MSGLSLALFLGGGCAESYNFHRIEIVYNKDDTKRDNQVAKQLLRQLGKCWSDTHEFKQIVRNSSTKLEAIGRSIRLIPVTNGDFTLVKGGILGEATLDMNDLYVFPDPIAKPSSKFTNPREFAEYPEGIPPWATTICAVLGHEIAEITAALEAGRWDWKQQHPTHGIPAEDSVVFGYSGFSRIRGADCGGVDHNGHRDKLLEIKNVGVERWHSTRQLVRMDDKGEILDQYDDEIMEDDDVSRSLMPSFRLAYITYHPGVQFPGEKDAMHRCHPFPQGDWYETQYR